MSPGLKKLPVRGVMLSALSGTTFPEASRAVPRSSTLLRLPARFRVLRQLKRSFWMFTVLTVSSIPRFRTDPTLRSWFV